MRRMIIGALLLLPRLAVGQSPIDSVEYLRWLRRDDYLRITATTPRLDGAIALMVDRTRDSLIVRRRRFEPETYQGSILIDSIVKLEVMRRGYDVSTWKPILAAIAGGALFAGVTYAGTCAVHPCRDFEGAAVPIMGIFGFGAGAAFGQWYFNRGAVRWVPVVLPRTYPPR